MLKPDQRSIASIKSEAYFRMLETMGPLMDSPHLSRVNRVVSWLLVHVFVPLLERVVRQRVGLAPQFRIESRHSVRKASDYNVFFSDLDLTVVLPETQLARSEQICRYIEDLKRFFPFLGEVEAYSISEAEELYSLMARVGEFHKFLRDIRKLTWIEGDDRRFKTRYHQLKYERAVRKILSNSSVTTGALDRQNVRSCARSIEKRLLSMNLPTDVPDLQFQVFSKYLNFGIKQDGFESRPDEDVVCLASPVGLWLLALTPFEAKSEGLRSGIESLRRHESIQGIWKALLRIEAITMGGVHRASPTRFPWIPEWKSQLESWYPKTN